MGRRGQCVHLTRACPATPMGEEALLQGPHCAVDTPHHSTQDLTVFSMSASNPGHQRWLRARLFILTIPGWHSESSLVGVWQLGLPRVNNHCVHWAHYFWGERVLITASLGHFSGHPSCTYEWTLFKHGIKSLKLKLITKCSPFEPCKKIMNNEWSILAEGQHSNST